MRAVTPIETGIWVTRNRYRLVALVALAAFLFGVACRAEGPSAPTVTPESVPAPSASLLPPPAKAPSGIPAAEVRPAFTEAAPAPSPTPRYSDPSDGVENLTGGPPVPASSITVLDPDPDWEAGLKSAGLHPTGWRTDFRFHTVPYREIMSGGVPRDGIPPLDRPVFTTTEAADEWLDPLEPVVALEINGDKRAYPLQILTWHEIVNDVVGETPVAVTFCPLCNSAIAFERVLDGVTYDFGTTGKLRKSDLVMWDRQTESWWQQLTGEAIAGVLAGNRLDFYPASIISWEAFKADSPNGQVLSQETGFFRAYGVNPYPGYDEVDNPPFLYRGDLDDRLLPKERVVAITIGERALAIPFLALAEERVVNLTFNGVDLAVFFEPGAKSALDDFDISDSQEVGASGVFDPVLNGQKLTFQIEGDQTKDLETGSTWNILGAAVEGALSGEQLGKVIHANHFWFAWAAFKPDTEVYQPDG